MDDLSRQRQLYQNIHLSDRIGFGERPAVLVIDMCRGMTEPGHRLSINMEAAFEPLQEILQAARRKGAPVIYTTVAYKPPDMLDGGMFIKKVSCLREYVEGSPLTEINPRCAPEADDIVITKKFQSAFCGTNLHSILTAVGIDTTIVVGTSTSGCVRATTIDAVSAGYRVIVPRECVADRAPLSHEVNLFDIDSKIGDVVTAAETIAYLARLPDGALSPTEIAGSVRA